MKDLTEALQADAGFRSVHLTGSGPDPGCVCGSWNSTVWPSILPPSHSAPSNPVERLSLKCTIILKKKKTTPPKNRIQFWKPICWSTHFVETFSMCGLVCSQLNNRILCIADSNSEEARKDTLSYSAWKRREGRPESVCPGGKLIQRQHFLKKQLASNLNTYCMSALSGSNYFIEIFGCTKKKASFTKCAVKSFLPSIRNSTALFCITSDVTAINLNLKTQQSRWIGSDFPLLGHEMPSSNLQYLRLGSD